MDARGRTALGFGLAAGGELSYLLQGASSEITLLSIGESLGMIAALGVASWAVSALRPRALAIALVIALVDQIVQAVTGILRGPFAVSTFPSVLVPVGYALVASSARPSGGHAFGVRMGAVVIVVGTMTWWFTDPSNITSGWLPGEALTLVGFGLVAGAFEPLATAGAAPAADAPA